MTHWVRVASIVAGSVAGLGVVAGVGAISVSRTDWFHNFVREKIVTSVEEGTGGKVDIGSFDFDWHYLRATIRNFVIHGLEAANEPPLLRANLLQVDLKLLSPLRGFIDIHYLLIDTPQANVIVFPDGRTNIPEPKIKKQSDKSGLETVVNLAIGKFDLRNGSVLFAQRKTELNASGANLRAEIGYDPLNHSYSGELDISPLHVRSAGAAPVDVNVKLPVKLEKDRITLSAAQLRTSQSEVIISGSIQHMNAPIESAHINARVALDELNRAAGLSMSLDTRHGPRILTADVNADVDEQNRIRIRNANLALGGTSIEASGNLQDPKNGAIRFNGSLALGELGRLFRVEQQPQGTVQLSGNATLTAGNQYFVAGDVRAHNVALRQVTTRLTGINLDSAVRADSHRIQFDDLRLAALGGSFAGNAAIEEMERFQVAGNLSRFDIDQLLRTFQGKSVGYDGVISGPVHAEGNFKTPAATLANVKLNIAPGRRGIPVSGHLAANYNGRADTVVLAPSYVALPHTRVDLSGALNRQLDVKLVSRDMSDFKPVADVPVTFTSGGAATVNATVTGNLSAPRIAAEAAVTNFTVEGRPFTRLAASLNASPSAASVTNGVLTHNALAANFSASVGLRNWSAPPNSPLRADATVRNADLQDVLAMAGQSNSPATGALSADAHITGTLGSPVGNADLNVANGTLEGEHFDSLVARVNMTDRAIDLPSATLTAGASHLDATAHYQHVLNDLTNGTANAHVNGSGIQLAQFQSLVKDRPGLRGAVALNADASVAVHPAPPGTQVDVTAVNGNFSATGLAMQGKQYGDLNAAVTTAGQTARYNVTSDFAGSTIRVNGQSLLKGDHQTTADASIANLPIDAALAIAGESSLAARGTLSANAHVSGTLDDPHANGDVTVVKGMVSNEPFDRLQVTAQYTNQSVDVHRFRIEVGQAWVEANAALTHPAGDFNHGNARFHLNSNQIQLARIHAIQQAKPGLDGTLQLAADGAASLRPNDIPLFSTLDANISAKSVTVDKKPVGDLTATANTHGTQVDFNLNSDFAHSNIRGNGTMQLGGDYPVNARVTFANVTYSGMSAWTGATQSPFDASTEGEITVNGPVSDTNRLQGQLQLTRLEAHSISNNKKAGAKPRVTFELHNAGPVIVALANSVVTVRSAHITGNDVDLNVTGTASTAASGLKLRADGHVNLELAQAFSSDIFSAGTITLAAAITGTTDKPSVNGQLRMQNASFNILDAPNGLSNANGVINFNGTQAVIQSLSGETGGGKVTLAGFVTYGGPQMQFRIQSTATRVHIAYPESVTTEASAQLTLAGTAAASTLTGNVYLLDVALHSQSDVGSMLTSASEPPSLPSANMGPLAGMHFDVRIRTASSFHVRTSLAQNVDADANLTLRGTLDHPGMLGRVNINGGQAVFFGANYNIDQGSVAFYNATEINPYVNLDLDTSVQGVDVSLNLAGPMDRLKLTYRSDPPLQFSDLVSLLASGKQPTTDPVLVAHSQQPPQQSVEQSGASALVGAAVANPISNRLQRLFGVTKLSINPQIVGSNTAQATLTLQQQVTREITFTYIQDVTQSNTEVIRVEWAINPRWSAVAMRDFNGEFDVNLFYKRRYW